MFVIEKDDEILNECRFLKNDIKRLYKEFGKKIKRTE